jgi:hypothetical protein
MDWMSLTSLLIIFFSSSRALLVLDALYDFKGERTTSLVEDVRDIGSD